MPERRSVIDLPNASSPEWQATAEVLRETVGLVTSIDGVALLLSEAGQGYTAASGGTTVVQSQRLFDFEDARIDQIRLVGWGGSSGSGDSVRVRDVTDTPVTLCTATVASGSATWITGDWTLVDTIGGGTRRLLLEVVGNGARTQTLHRVELQVRTLRHVRK